MSNVHNYEEEIIKSAVDKFLAWHLPDDFFPDGGIVRNVVKGAAPLTGTNLLTAEQAREMFEYVLGDSVAALLQKVEIEAVRRDRLANAKFYKEQVGKIFDKEVQTYEAALRNQTGEQTNEPQGEKFAWGNRKKTVEVYKKRNNGWGR